MVPVRPKKEVIIGLLDKTTFITSGLLPQGYQVQGTSLLKGFVSPYKMAKNRNVEFQKVEQKCEVSE
jgi:hypothetical protein